VITYVDTSVLLKLLVDDELGAEAAERLWLESTHLVCAEIGYTEVRAALAATRRSGRLDQRSLRTAKAELDALWGQIDIVPVTTSLVHAAGDLAEDEGLRGYDAVHLAAAIAAQATVVATADTALLEAARRRRFDVSNPLEPAEGIDAPEPSQGDR
jgi:predicted nucleic acid-binding protein